MRNTKHTHLSCHIALSSRTDPEDAEKEVTPYQLIRKPGIFLNLVVLFVNFINIGCNEALLSHHLEESVRVFVVNA